MSPDACPFCGAPVVVPFYDGVTYYLCGSAHDIQDPACARYVRVRISQLRRMAHIAWRASVMLEKEHDRERMERFQIACLREIERLRGGA